MPYEITCFRCRHILYIEEGNTRPSLTCPHCLALVVNPRALVRTDLPAKRLRGDSLDDEVRRDNRGGVSIAVVLGVMVAIGAIVFLAGSGSKLVSGSKDGQAVFGIGILVLGAIAAGTVAVVVKSESKVVTTLTSVFGGLIVGAGVVVLIIVLVCMGMLQTCGDCGK